MCDGSTGGVAASTYLEGALVHRWCRVRAADDARASRDGLQVRYSRQI